MDSDFGKDPPERPTSLEKADPPTPRTPEANPSQRSPEPVPPLLSRLPTWVATNLHSARSWKLLLRCWIACWASFLIILPSRSLRTLGTTGFFALLTSLFLPPNLPVQMFLIIASTLMLGILSGWALGIAAMRAANASRNQDLLHRVYQQVQQSIASDPVARANPTLAFELSIFQGVFLDTRSSAVYGCFLGVGVFVFGLVRAYAPKLMFLSIFGTIALDIFCTIAPLFPTNYYTLLQSLTISAASYIAIACVVTLLVFPQTTNHICMAMISAQLGKIRSLITIQEEVLHSSPQDLTIGTPLVDRIRGARSALIAAQRQMMSMVGTINLEFSMGKWNGDDVRELGPPLLALVIRIAGLQSFAKLVGDLHSVSMAEATEGSSTASSSTITVGTPSTNDSYLLKQVHQRNLAAERTHSVSITDLIPLIKEATDELRRACVAGLGAVQATIDLINDRRWARRIDLDEQNMRELEQAIALLSAAQSTFKETKRKRLVEPYIMLIRKAKSRREQEALPLRSLFLAFVFASDLIVVTNSILTLMEMVRDKANKRKNNRLWAPKGLRLLWKVLLSRGSKEDAGFGEDASPKTADDERNESYRRDPDSKPPTNVFQKVMDRLHQLWKWCGTAEAMFTLKYVVITIALWIPSVCKSTAHFYFVQRGVWALIMAQTTLNIYAADQIFNLVCRLIGTLVGLVFGLLAWFAGNGRGIGNRFGAAASVGLVIIPFVFIRIFAPPQYLAGVILACATFALIVGYSWVDGHIAQIYTPGIGWPIAWKRWVLVVIGAAASFIIMMLPPTSGRKAVRIRNAVSVVGLSHVYGFLISTWISTHSSEQRSPDTPASWIQDFRTRLLQQAEEITAVRQLTAMAKWEGSIRGAWPAEEYVRLVDVQSDMISSLAHLGGALGHLGDNWRLTFLHSTKVLNPHFISDVMSIFTLVSQSLRTGEPMHQVLPNTLCDRLFYHHHRSNVLPHSPEHKQCIDVEEVQSLDYMYYAAGLVAVYQLLESLDELHRITKRLCGEVPLAGFTSWKDEYERMRIQV